MATDHGKAASFIPAAGVLFLMPDAEASISEEPGARKGHAGICAGAVRATGRPTAMPDGDSVKILRPKYNQPEVED